MLLWAEIERAYRTHVRKLQANDIPGALTEACRMASKYDDYEVIKVGPLGSPSHMVDRTTVAAADYIGCLDPTFWTPCP